MWKIGKQISEQFLPPNESYFYHQMNHIFAMVIEFFDEHN